MRVLILILLISIMGCVPNTKYSITDDYATGLRWFERAYKDPDAYKHAIRYWRPLANKGDCDAQYRMGLMYFAGLGVSQSFNTAYLLWVKAANGNQQRAQWALGDLYYQSESDVFHHCRRTPGCTIEQNSYKALFWYKLFEKSAKYKSEKEYVAHILPKVKIGLNEERILVVQNRVNNWKPIPKDCGARKLW